MPFVFRRFLPGELTLRGKESCRSQLTVLLISPKIHEANAIIILGRRRNEIGIWQDKLVALFIVEIRDNDDAISITIQRRTENLIPFPSADRKASR